MPNETARAKTLLSTLDAKYGPVSKAPAARPLAAPKPLSDAKDRWGQPRSIGDNIRVRRSLTRGTR